MLYIEQATIIQNETCFQKYVYIKFSFLYFSVENCNLENIRICCIFFRHFGRQELDMRIAEYNISELRSHFIVVFYSIVMQAWN